MSARDQLWHRVYNTARDVYTSIPGYNDWDARLTANAAAEGWYKSTPNGYRKRVFRGLSLMPSHGDTFDLQSFTELEYVTDQGEIRGVSFDPKDGVSLRWSDSKQALYILPRVKESACVYPPRKNEDRLSRIWAQGRPAKCSSRTLVKNPPMRVAYPAIQVSYRSDKFGLGDDGKPISYIHHHEPGVVVYFSEEPFGARRAPEAIMIRGGKLRLTSHGIDG